MHARFPLFMHFHAWDFTSFIILEGVSVSRSTIIISRGGGHLKYEKKTTNGLGMSRVPGPSEINPALQKRKCGYLYGTHIFFNVDIFLEQIFV